MRKLLISFAFLASPLNAQAHAQTIKAIPGGVVVTLPKCTTACPDSTLIRYVGASTVTHVRKPPARYDTVFMGAGTVKAYVTKMDATVLTATIAGPVTSPVPPDTTPTPPPSTGDPVPSGTILLDTRAGGAQSWQGAGITTPEGALAKIRTSPAVTGASDWYPTVGAWAANADGAGTSAMRSDVDRWDTVKYPNGQDGGGDEWSVSFVRETYGEVYVQLKYWLGRTATSGYKIDPTNGGTPAQIGAYEIINPAAAATGTGSGGFKFLHIWRSVGAGSAIAAARPGMTDSRMDWLFGGGTVNVNGAIVGTFSPSLTYDNPGNSYSPSNIGAVFPSASTPYAPNGAKPANMMWHTITFYYKPASSETAADGRFRWVHDGVTVLDFTGATGNYKLSAISWPSTHRSVKDNYVEMFKDLVVWSPRP